MRVEPRFTRPEIGPAICRGFVVIAETPAESSLIDECFGKTVGPDGLIAVGDCEVRLADGYGEHYMLLKAREDK